MAQGVSGSYERIQDGHTIQAGKRRLAVSVQGDPSEIDRVFVSDGGLYQVEALRDGDLYVCDFDVKGDRLYKTLLVQAIHVDGRASKEKFVLKTFKSEHDDRLILNGIGMLASADLLDGVREQVAELLNGVMERSFACMQDQDDGMITHISFGDGDPDTVDLEVVTLEPVRDDLFPGAVLHVELIIHDVDLSAVSVYGQDLITTRDNDLVLDLYLALDDMRTDGTHGIVLDLMDSAQVHFTRDFFLRTVVEDKIQEGLQVIELPPLAADLRQIADAMGDALPVSISIDDTMVDLGVLFSTLDMDLSQYLFVDVYGTPEDTSSEGLALGAGLFLAAYAEAGEGVDDIPGSSPFDAEGIFDDLCAAMTDAAFEKIRNDYSGLVRTLTYGDGSPATQDVSIKYLQIQDASSPSGKTVRMDFTISDVDLRAVSLFGLDLITTRDNDLSIDATFSIAYRQNAGNSELVLDVLDVSSVDFQDFFIGRTLVEELVRKDMKDMEESVIGLDEVLDDAGIDLCVSGREAGRPLFPFVLDAYSPYAWDLQLLQGNSLRVAVSQDTLNWMLSRLTGQGFEWDVYEILRPILGNEFAGFEQERLEGEETILRLSVPPVLDLRSGRIRMQLDDVEIEYRLGEVPQWTASVDLDLIVTVQVEGGGLAFYLDAVPEQCHFHIMRDNAGKLALLDHSGLVNDIVQRLPEMLGEQAGGPLFTVSFSSMEGFLALEDVDAPVWIYADQGYLYVDAAVCDMDLTGLLEQLLLD
ncbi:MAG TPA: hypothetical protein PLR71_09050, partial [Deltaproteobacteria bacterium]|nr:hypothetical protein [Deltaproteobacteria bacterium]